MELNDVHKAQISRFITFFKGKRERLLSDRERDKSDFICDRLSDEGAIFNSQDVQDLIEAYHAQLIGQVRESVDEMTGNSAVYMSQLFAQAEQVGFSLDTADILSCEDHSRADQIAALANQGMAPLPAPMQKPMLPSLSQAGPDPAMMAKLQEMEHENGQMRQRYQQMQEEVSKLLTERSSLSQELEKVNFNFAQVVEQMQQMSPDAANSINVVEVQNSLAHTQAHLEAKQSECDQMRQDLSQRLGDSSQFKELKAIVKKKSEEVKQMRQVLAQHGLHFQPVSADGVELAPEDD
jgi:hypothetical protein